jgi:DNA primase
MRPAPSDLDNIRAHLPPSLIVGRRVKLKRTGRVWKGLCCLHSEKTPSLVVDDRRETWKCFGCGEGGDIFAFLMKCDGLSFSESVERLAAEAGVALPQKKSAEIIAQEKHHLSLIEVVELAAGYYADQLSASPAARAYVKTRGLEAMVKPFRLGYAPAERSALKNHLASKGIDQSAAVEAGLIVAGDDVPVSFDRFRNRLMFPIRDPKGRVIGFGGRALDKAPAKYLNSPESPIFDKGANLFNQDRARPAAHEGAEVVAVEGYVDCLAAVGAEMPATVATMGTAMTEGHLRQLWRLSDVPVMCFDGDDAGKWAMRRVMEMSFPLLSPGRSLRFAVMPDALDPDDVIHKRGAPLFRSLVASASGLADSYWQASIEANGDVSVDGRGRLERDMAAVLGSIKDAQLRQKYLADMRKRINSLTWQPKVHRSNGYSNHSTSPGSIRLAFSISNAPGTFSLKDAVYLASAVAAPEIASQTAEEIAADLGLSERARAVMCELLYLMAERPEIESGDLLAELRGGPLAGEIDAALATVQQAGISSIGPGDAARVLRRR